jgi:hypothetical protein
MMADAVQQARKWRHIGRRPSRRGFAARLRVTGCCFHLRLPFRHKFAEYTCREYARVVNATALT